MATLTYGLAACAAGFFIACGSVSEGPTGASGPGGASASGSATGSGASVGSGGSGGATGTGGSATASSGTTTMTTGVGGSGPAPIHFIGRFDTSDPVGPLFAWPGSAIAARFSGTGIDIELHDSGDNYFEVVIDDGTPAVLATNGAKNKYTLASNLPAGEHDLWIQKRTESYMGVVQFVALTPKGGTMLVPTEKPFLRTIEIIGDSITCGYGADGVGPNCSASGDLENDYLAYGAVAARALDAASINISYSGIGVYRSFDGSTKDQMPVRYLRTLADDPTSTWNFATKPDVVVINLGDNDFAPSDPGQPYINAYTAFVKKVRGNYPKAFILLAVGPMLAGESLAQAKAYTKGIVNALTSAGDARLSFVDLGQQDGDANGLGCDSHPSVKTHAILAKKLTAAIKLVTGW